MRDRRLREIIRQFNENGLKLLLENPWNVRELLLALGFQQVELIDFSRMHTVRGTFVQRDFRHVEADLVLYAPLKGRKRGVTVYILIEQQSEPEERMVLRVLEYVVQVYKRQVREQRQNKKDEPLAPVVPVVLYTGNRNWDALPSLSSLVAGGDLFAAYLPTQPVLFFNLKRTPADQLEAADGIFRGVLRVLQEREASPGDFRQVLRRLLEQLEALPESEAPRWREVLTYLHALVYHVRNPVEQEGLIDLLGESAQTHGQQEHVMAIKRTGADVMMAEGMKIGVKKGELKGELKALRKTLLRLLRTRFGDLPPEIVERVQQTSETTQLESWLDECVTAKALEKMSLMK